MEYEGREGGGGGYADEFHEAGEVHEAGGGGALGGGVGLFHDVFGVGDAGLRIFKFEKELSMEGGAGLGGGIDGDVADDVNRFSVSALAIIPSLSAVLEEM